MKLASKLNEICGAKGLSLSKLAKEAGVPVQTIHAWTTGRKSINPVQIKKVASVLKISIHQLLFAEPDPHETTGEEVLKVLFPGDVRFNVHKIEINMGNFL